MKKQFTFENDKHVQQTIEVSDADFEMNQQDKNIHDQKFQTKPTTFFKDALKRFTKNKSSVVGGVVLGVIVLLAFVLPVALPYDISGNGTAANYEIKLPGKLFSSGTGWWDGNISYKGIAYDEANQTPAGFEMRAVSDLNVSEIGDSFTDTVSKYASGGYIRLNTAYNITDETFLSSYYHAYDFGTNQYNVTVDIGQIPSGFEYGTQGTYGVFFHYYSLDDTKDHYVTLKDYSTDTGTFTFNINEAVSSYTTTNSLAALTKTTIANNPTLVFKLKSTITDASLVHDGDEQTSSASSEEVSSDSTDTTGEEETIVKSTNLLINKVTFASNNASDTEKEELSNLSCLDANAALLKTKANGDKYYWTVNAYGQMNLYHADIRLCSFKYDKYEIVYGVKTTTCSDIDARKYVANGYMNLDYTTFDAIASPTAADVQALVDSFELLDDACPIRSLSSGSYIMKNNGQNLVDFTGELSMYRWLGYSSMPIHLFGTDALGRDMLKYVFDGLKTSLLLGLITSAICFTFGLIYGSITGYFGGWTDIIMERFTDILSGMPWIVVMTLCIIHLGSNFQTFALALCLTGWIGTSSITRTQFYRFKGREYILAARTLGASDARLIFRHILPNAVGTIITSAVLMIPSVIFSEATISYLGLGLKGLSSLGVILSDNQIFISTMPILIVFPSVVMALIMISFNLFGNGLRDAFNPSLKGSE